MNKLLILLTILTINIYAKNGGRHYVGIGGGITRASTYTTPKELMSDVTIKYGFSAFKHLDIEARGSFYVFGGTKLYHLSSYGVFLKPNYDLTTKTNIYTLLGYTRNTLSKKDTTHTNSITIQDDISYGGGFEYSLFGNTYGYMDYLRYIDKSTIKPEGKYSIKIDSLSLGVNYRFGNEPKNEEPKTKEKSLEKIYTKLPKREVKREGTVLTEFTVIDDMEQE